jgi:hypothetical protein
MQGSTVDYTCSSSGHVKEIVSSGNNSLQDYPILPELIKHYLLL